MSNIAHEEDLAHGYRIEIEWDDEPINPRKEYDNLGIMVFFDNRRRYDLGDEVRADDPLDWLIEFAALEWGYDHIATMHWKPGDDWDVLGEADNYEVAERVHQDSGRLLFEQINKRYLLLSLHLYEHSSLSVRSSPFQWWDHRSPSGFIYVSREAARKEWPTDEQALEFLRGEVDTYDLYLTGQCYGYRVFGPPEYDQDGEEIEDSREELDSCWGFLGDLDFCLEHARDVAAQYIAEHELRPLPRDRSLALIPSIMTPSGDPYAQTRGLAA